jgi:hypothetical protein
MAKSQVSEEELAKGLKGIGNFSGLSPRVQRDNPFRDSRQEKVEPPKTIEVRLPSAEPQVAKPTAPNIAPDEPKPMRAFPATPKLRPKVREGESKSRAEESARTADDFEPVTLQISPEMRDETSALARDLQRAKTTKVERITANTVMRVALRLLLENYQFELGDVANTETELYDLVVQRVRGGRLLAGRKSSPT